MIYPVLKPKIINKSKMKNFTLLTFALLLLFASTRISLAQNLRGKMSASTSWNRFSGIHNGDQWSFEAEANKVYHFSFCNDFGGGKSIGDPVLKISDKEGNTLNGSINDDYCGKNAYVVWPCKNSGTYYLTAYNSEKSSSEETILAFKVANPVNCETGLRKSVVNISSLPYSSGPFTTRGAKNKLNESTMGSLTNYFNNQGEDMIYSFSPVTDGYVHMALDNNSSNVSMQLFEGCPLAGNQNKMIGKAFGDHDLSIAAKVNSEKTYFLVLDSKIPTYNFFYRNLKISAPNKEIPSINEQNSISTLSDLNDNTKIAIDVDVKANVVICRWMSQKFAFGTYYEVERSTNGVDFTKIGKVDALVDASNEMEYHFEDAKVSEHEKYFYRLKVVEPSGNLAYSKSVATIIKENGTAVLEVRQEEDKQQLTVNYVLSSSSIVTIEIVDETGKIVKKYQQGLQQKGQYTFPFSVKGNGLPSGKYKVSVWIDEDHYTANVQDVE
jgi:hypothetical protein